MKKKSIQVLLLLMAATLVFCSCGNIGEEEKKMDEYDKTTGFGNEEINIRLPQIKKEVDASTFGMDVNSIDNNFALLKAFTYCALNPNTKLNIPKGIYRFDSAMPIVMGGGNDILIEGNGSEFIFADIGYLQFNNCDSVIVQNLTIDWDWDYQRLASLAEVSGIAEDKSYVDFIFPEVEEVDPDMAWMTMNQFDPETLTPGVEKGKEFWNETLYFDSVEKTGANQLRVFHNGSLNSLQTGEVYLVRHQTYGGNVFTMINSSNMSFKNTTIYSAVGMGFLVLDGTHHYQIKDCRIMIRPGTNRHITTTADGIHSTNTKGYAWIENCDLSYMGDDCININDTISVVSSIDGSNSCTVNNYSIFKIGDVVKFRTADFTDIGFESVITDIISPDSTGALMEFDKPLPAEIGEGAILSNQKYNSSHYVIRNNYFHENRARGMLLRTGNGLVENNRLYKTQGAAILIQVDIAPLWAEGTGLENLLIRNNTFDTCNVNDWSALVDFAVNIPGGRPSQPVFRNIDFEQNQFLNFPSRSFYIVSAENVKIDNNTFKNDVARRKESPARETIWIERSKAVTITNNSFVKSDFVKHPMQITMAEEDQLGELVNQGNKIVD